MALRQPNGLYGSRSAQWPLYHRISRTDRSGLKPQTRLCEFAAQARYLRSRNQRVVIKPPTDARRRRHVVKNFKLFKTFKTPDSINLIRHC